MDHGYRFRYGQRTASDPLLIVPKFLIIRFSAIGDIVLTSPVIRCLKEQVPGAEIHFLTKAVHKPLLECNPHISKIITIEKNVREVIQLLNEEKYDRIVDLHHNLRSWETIKELGVPASSFPKLNLEKWLLVNIGINRLPDLHIVDRYMKTVEYLGIKNDNKGLDFYYPSEKEAVLERLPSAIQNNYIAMVTGATHFTKQMPADKLAEIIRASGKQFALLGGKQDIEKGRKINSLVPDQTTDLCGQLDIHESAVIIKHAQKVITHDTGLMHIAAAFKKEIISLWGNTLPEFGMYPYQTGNGEKGVGFISEVKNLKCRPCSKLGHEACPKGHFKCMLEQDSKKIVDWLIG